MGKRGRERRLLKQSGGVPPRQAPSDAEESDAGESDAEADALLMVVRLVLATRRVIELSFGRSLAPTVVYCDNEGVLARLRNRDVTSPRRHTRVALALVIDAQDADLVEVRLCTSAEQTADIFTAAEARDRHRANTAILLGEH